MYIIKKVFSDSAFTAVNIIVSTIRGIIIIPIITGIFGAEGYGTWATIFGAVTLISTTGGLHLRGSLIRYIDDDLETEQTYIDILFLSSIIGFFIFIFILLGGLLAQKQLFDLLGRSGSIRMILATGILCFTKIILPISVNLPRAKGAVKTYELIQVAKIILETLLIALSFFLLDFGIVDTILTLGIYNMIFNILLIVAIISRYNIPAPSLQNFQKYLRYGIPMVPREMSGPLLNNADKILILYFISPSAVGLYAVSYNISIYITKFSDVLNSSLYPSVTKAWDNKEFSNLRELYYQIFRYYSIISIPSTVGVIFLSNEIIQVISTPSIAKQSRLLIPILIGGFLIRGYAKPLVYIFTSSENTLEFSKIIFISTIVNVILNILLINIIGTLGAAISTIISQSLIFVLIFVRSRNIFKFIIPITSIRNALLSSLGMLALLIFINLQFSAILTILLNAITGAAVYFLLMVLLGEFSQDELRFIPNILK